jgi:hypothetical protein
MTAALAAGADALVPEEDFWGPPLAAAMRLGAAVADHEGLGLAAPAIVDVGARGALPVLAFEGRGGQPRAFHEHAVLHALDLGTGDGRAARLRGDGVPGATTAAPTAVTRVDARELLDLDWRPGELLLTLLVQDRVARARVRLAGAAALDDERRAAPGALTLPARPHPDAAPGLVIEVDPVSRGQRWMLRGALRLPLPAGQGAPGAQAVVPVDLLLVGSVTPAPIRVPLRLAVDGSGDEAAGAFEVDLDQALEPEARATVQRFWVTAFSGEAMARPVPTTRLGASRT